MIPVLYEDTDIIVVNKPANMPSQRDFSRTPDVLSEVENHCNKPLFLIHRLDRHVAGPLVIGKTADAAKKLNSQLTGEGFEKVYLAIVKGDPSNQEDLFDYITKEKNVAKCIHVDDYNKLKAVNQKNYKKALMNYRCLNKTMFNNENLAIIEIRLITGRFHQIRCQLQCNDMPIVGDPKYGVKAIGTHSFNKIGLQCIKLAFEHPKTKKYLEFIVDHKESPYDLFL